MKRSPLKRPTLAKVRAFEEKQREKALAREPKPRKAIARRGRKATRETPEVAAFAAMVRERARGLCDVEWFVEDQVELEHVCGTTNEHPGVHAHHLCPSDRDRGVHDPARGAWLCARAHAFVHGNPAWSYDAGLLIRAGS